MARAGRKRKNAAREPNGRVKRGETVDQIRSVVIAQRAKVVPLNQARSQLCASAVGRLFLNGKITRAQREAGDKFTEIIGRWRWALSAPSPNPSGSRALADNMERSKEQAEPLDAVRHFMDEADEIQSKHKAMSAYKDAKNALMDAGTAAYLATMMACDRDQEPFGLDPLKAGLSALVKLFKITEDYHMEPIDGRKKS